MDLREYLQTLGAGAELAGQTAVSTGRLRQQGLMEDLAAEAPSLIEQGQFGDVASMAAGAGDLSLLREMYGQAMKPAKEKPVGFTADELVTQGIPRDKATVFAKLDPTLQKEAVSNFESTRSSNIAAENLALQQREAQRRVEEVTQKQRSSAAKILGDFEKDISEEQRAIKKVNEALKSGSLTGDAIVLNFIARNMAGEKGPLAEGDIKRLVGTSFAGDVQGARNYVQSLASSTASAEQRRVYKEMLKIAANNHQSWRQDAAVKAFSQAIENNPKLVDGGKIDKQITSKAERLGFEARLNDDGNLELVKKQKKTAPINPVNPETGVPDITALEQQIELITDARIKASAKAKIEQAKKAAASGKPLNPDQLNKLGATIKTFISQ
jgi:tetratricopeptide (TPR) repeat protein